MLAATTLALVLRLSPEDDARYRGSAHSVREAIVTGVVFKKKIVAVFATRREASPLEIAAHQRKRRAQSSILLRTLTMCKADAARLLDVLRFKDRRQSLQNEGRVEGQQPCRI